MIKPTLAKPCVLCKKKIYLKVDRYCRIQDYDKGKMFLEGYYHTKCYVDKIKENKDSTDALVKKASKMLDQLGLKLDLPINEKVEVVTI
jgi:hypothetical protein